jgi:8-oxo-dGTP pyrophosphatase MutT (NUDIX family)
MDSTERVDLRCSAIIFRGPLILLLRRERGESVDWVLPGGTPGVNESLASCARREVLEETGLRVAVDKVAFVLEANDPDGDLHRLDLVFTATETGTKLVPQELEAGLTPVFYPLEEIAALPLRPPIAGHLRGLRASRGRTGAAYLGNVWRPDNGASPAQTASGRVVGDA